MVKKIVCAFLILSLGVLPASCSRPRKEGPDAVVARFVMLWEQGCYPEMYDLLSTESKKAWDAENFVSRYTKISSGIGLKGVKLHGVSLEGKTISYVLEFLTSTVGNFRQNYSLQCVEEGGLWRLHCNHGHIFPELTADRVVRVTRQMPARGSILDRHNLPLAAMGTVYSIGLVPGQMKDYTVLTLAELLELPAAEITDKLNQGWVKDNTFVPILTISSETWQELREALSALPGVTARETSSRVYNIPESLAHTVGYVGEIEAGQLEELADSGFMAGDIVGQEGLELIHDRDLAGQPGFTVTIRDSQNNTVSTLALREPVDGRDVLTTLDLEKSTMLDRVLGNRKGSILVMDFTTGELLGVASKPGFDCNLFARGITSSQYNSLMELDSPLFNRAINGLYPPGSIFKPFTALMALEQGVFDPSYSWDTPRQWQKSPDWGAYAVTRVIRPLGPVDLWEAMRWSDNVYFADLGVKVGWQAFENYCEALGFGAKIPLSLNNQVSQISSGPKGELLLADSSYGQGEVLATPLHMTLMYAAIARQDGILPIPRLTKDGDGQPWLATGFSPENLELVDRVLAYAASDKDALAWVGSDTVRGKTGTSEISQNRQIAWYICYFDNLVMTVTLEGDRSLSSSHAVELARECLNSGIRK